MDMEILVRLMQMQMVTRTPDGKSRGRGAVDPDFSLILAAALMDGQKGGHGIPPARQAVPAVKDTQGAVSSRGARSGARPEKVYSGAVKSAGPGGGLESMVDRVAAKYGLDSSLLRAVVKAESDFDPMAVSGAGAMGLMQLMPETASSLGVKDPFDPAENLDGGARYLKSMIQRFGGDIRLALAAYNAGPGAVDRHGGVPPYEETIAYINRINSMMGGLIG